MYNFAWSYLGFIEATRARLFKPFKGPQESKESIPPVKVAWRAGTSHRGCRTDPARLEPISGRLNVYKFGLCTYMF